MLDEESNKKRFLIQNKKDKIEFQTLIHDNDFNIYFKIIKEGDKSIFRIIYDYKEINKKPIKIREILKMFESTKNNILKKCEKLTQNKIENEIDNLKI